MSLTPTREFAFLGSLENMLANKFINQFFGDTSTYEIDDKLGRDIGGTIYSIKTPTMYV